MWLITGGAYQGKLDYALSKTEIKKEEVISGASCSLEELSEAPLIDDFHLFIRRMAEEGKEIEELQEQVRIMLEKNPHVVIIADEVGCGIIPMDRLEREYREMTGRICTRIAKEAETVHRVVCGIGMVIKHA